MQLRVTIPRLHQGLVIVVLLALLAVQSLVATSATPSAEAAPLLQSTPPNCQIQGYVFEDLDRDQEKDPGEPGLPGVRIDIFTVDSNATLTPVVNATPPAVDSFAITNSDGYFCFDRPFQPGSYRLVQQKVAGYEVTGGQERIVTFSGGGTVTVFFANVRVTPTPAPTFTPEPTRNTPTVGPTFTASPTTIPSATATVSPSTTVTPSQTATTSPTGTATTTSTATATPTTTATATTTPTTSPTSTLRSLTPIATFITTTPGVLVTTTPFPGKGPVQRLPETGSGSNLLLIASALGLLMLGAGLVRRLFFSR